MMNQKIQFADYVHELRRLGCKRRSIWERFLRSNGYWGITKKQAVEIINAKGEKDG